MIARAFAYSVTLALVVATSAFGQTRAAAADIVGTVADESGGIIRGAAVTITRVDTGDERHVTTDNDGRFAVPGLPVGTYLVLAAAPGFAPRATEPVDITVGASAVVNVVLGVGTVEVRVDVSGTAATVNRTRTDTSALVDSRQIAGLPINGRNFIDFATLNPGATVDRGSGSATSGINFTGAFARSNNISVDGVDNIDVVVGTVRAGVSQDAVREFQVIGNTFSAEFGKAAGGVVNIVTKSGTNQTSGTAFLFGRDARLDARGYFDDFDPNGSRVDRPKGPFEQWQFGGTFGGPIKQNRTFFFASFERQTTTASRFVSIDDQTVVMNPVAPVPLGTTASILRRAGFTFDTGNVPYDVRSTNALIKVDHELDVRNRLTARFLSSVGLNENDEPFGGVVAKSHATARDSRDWELAATWSRIHSDHLLNDLRIQFSRPFWDQLPLDPACGGPCVADTDGGPEVTVFGYATVGRLAQSPSHSRARRLQVIDTASYYRGAHEWKLGLDFGFRRAEPVTFPLNFGGGFYFVDLPDSIAPLLGLPHGISAIQAFALGIPGLYVQSYGNTELGEISQVDSSLFAQDDWRIAPELTLKLGVRLQKQSLSEFGYQASGIAPFQFPGDSPNIAPRLALAWNPGGDKKTNLHAAYGMFYDNNLLATIGISQVVQPATGLRTLVTSGPLALAAWSLPGHRLPEALATPFPSLQFIVDPGLRTPYSHQTSFGVDRELPHALMLSTSVVIARGQNQLGLLDYNPIVPALGPGRRPNDINGVAGTSTTLYQYTSFGRTWYSGLLASLSKRIGERGQFLASYTLSSSENNVDDFSAQPSNQGRGRNPADPTGLPLGFNPLDDRGPTLFDQRHRLVVSGMYRLPAKIDMASIVRVGSGLPYNITAGYDVNGDGVLTNPDRPRTNLLDPATEIPRNSGRLPAQATVDVRLSRVFPLAGSASFEGMFEVFNLFNRVNFTDINGVFGAGSYPSSPAASFGQYTQAGPPLQIQLAGRIRF